MAETRRAGIRARTWAIGGTVAAAVAVVVAIILLSRPTSDDGAPTPSPTRTATVSESTVSTEQLDQLVDDLKSGDPDTLSRVLALPADEVTAEITSGFAGLELAWDAASAEPANDDDGAIVGWNIPADVTQPDGTTSRWVVTVIAGEDGLIFLDSEEVPA